MIKTTDVLFVRSEQGSGTLNTTRRFEMDDYVSIKLAKDADRLKNLLIFLHVAQLCVI